MGWKMQSDITPIQAEKTVDRPRKGGRRGKLLTLSDLDRRTAAYKRTCAIISSLQVDLGGADRLSCAQRQLTQRAAMLGAILEDQESRWLAGEPIDPGAYTTLSNAQRRLLSDLGLERQTRDITPTLQEHLARKAAERATATQSEPTT
jgi:hypothetical protein